MVKGFVLGNGKSRLGCDLVKLQSHGPVYGCNALYRDFSPDALFALDKRMVDEICEKQYNKGEFIYRIYGEEAKVFGSKRVLKSNNKIDVFEDRGYSAGPTAALIICQRHKNIKEVFLIGFDLYGTVDGKVNNIYAGTKCYVGKQHKPTPFGSWIQHLYEVCTEYPNIQFYRVGNTDDECPKKWEKVSNIQFINYPKMNQMLEE